MYTIASSAAVDPAQIFLTHSLSPCTSNMKGDGGMWETLGIGSVIHRVAATLLLAIRHNYTLVLDPSVSWSYASDEFCSGSSTRSLRAQSLVFSGLGRPSAAAGGCDGLKSGAR